jgi:hypothetical protein
MHACACTDIRSPFSDPSVNHRAELSPAPRNYTCAMGAAPGIQLARPEYGNQISKWQFTRVCTCACRRQVREPGATSSSIYMVRADSGCKRCCQTCACEPARPAAGVLRTGRFQTTSRTRWHGGWRTNTVTRWAATRRYAFPRCALPRALSVCM